MIVVILNLSFYVGIVMFAAMLLGLASLAIDLDCRGTGNFQRFVGKVVGVGLIIETVLGLIVVGMLLL